MCALLKIPCALFPIFYAEKVRTIFLNLYGNSLPWVICFNFKLKMVAEAMHKRPFDVRWCLLMVYIAKFLEIAQL